MASIEPNTQGKQMQLIKRLKRRMRQLLPNNFALLSPTEREDAIRVVALDSARLALLNSKTVVDLNEIS